MYSTVKFLSNKQILISLVRAMPPENITYLDFVAYKSQTQTLSELEIEIFITALVHFYIDYLSSKNRPHIRRNPMNNYIQINF